MCLYTFDLPSPYLLQTTQSHSRASFASLAAKISLSDVVKSMVVETAVTFAGVDVEVVALSAMGVVRAAAPVIDVLAALAIVVLVVVGCAIMALAVIVGLTVAGAAATTGADGAVTAKGAQVPEGPVPAPTTSVGDDIVD